MRRWSGSIATTEPWRLIDGASLAAAPWRNGLGVSREIASVPGLNGGFGWQVGIADLERSSAFSDFPGCDRIFTPIAGEPVLELAVDGGAFAACPLLTPKPFPGDVPTESRVMAPGRAFNVVWERARFEADVEVLHLAAGDPLPIESATHIVLYCHAGEVASAEGRLAAGDSLVGPGPATPATAVSDAVVIAVAIRLR